MKPFRLGEASGVHFADEYAPAFLQLIFVSQARREILHIEAERDFSACLGKRGDHGVVSAFHKSDVEHQSLLIADDLNFAVEPGGNPATTRESRFGVSITMPSIRVRMSPGLMPAAAAGFFSKTSLTNTPSPSLTPNLRANSAVSGWIPMPSQPRVTPSLRQ